MTAECYALLDRLYDESIPDDQLEHPGWRNTPDGGMVSVARDEMSSAEREAFDYIASFSPGVAPWPPEPPDRSAT